MPPEPNATDDLTEEPGVQAPESTRVPLPSGDGLTPADVDEFLRWRPVRFVTIVGDRESGKTTLVCAIYDRFLRGPFAGYMLAGSRTFVALETKSHYSRVDSGSVLPETARTSISEGLRFFHFCLAPVLHPTAHLDLMLADRAGETYKQARNRTALVAELIEVAKADRIVLLLDGARVAAPAERAGALQAVRQSVRVFLDNGAVNASSRVQVVTTKLDLLSNHGESDLIKGQLKQFADRLTEDFGGQVAELSFWEIAARDPRSVFGPAHGLDDLVKDWATARPIDVRPKELVAPMSTEFDRLLVRTERRFWS